MIVESPSRCNKRFREPLPLKPNRPPLDAVTSRLVPRLPSGASNDRPHPFAHASRGAPPCARAAVRGGAPIARSRRAQGVVGRARAFAVSASAGKVVEKGDSVAIHYVGTLENGEQFDSLETAVNRSRSPWARGR